MLRSCKKYFQTFISIPEFDCAGKIIIVSALPAKKGTLIFQTLDQLYFGVVCGSASMCFAPPQYATPLIVQNPETVLAIWFQTPGKWVLFQQWHGEHCQLKVKQACLKLEKDQLQGEGSLNTPEQGQPQREQGLLLIKQGQFLWLQVREYRVCKGLEQGHGL